MKKCYIIEKRVRFIISEMSLERISDGARIRLRTPAAICLKLLLEKKGDVVTHNDLYSSCWENFGMTASQNVLHNTIYFLRKALTETGCFEEKTIYSLNRRGFVFNRNFNVEVVELNNDSDEIRSENHTTEISDFDNNNPREEFAAKEGSILSSANKINLINDSYMDRMVVFHFYCQYHYKESCEFFHGSADAKVKDASVLASKESAVDGPAKFGVDSTGNQAKKNYTIKLIAIVISGLILIDLFILLNKEALPWSNQKVGVLEQCDVYQNSDAYDYKNLKAIEYLKKHCNEKRALYMKFHPYTKEVFALNCKNKISLFSEGSCYSNYFSYKDSAINDV